MEKLQILVEPSFIHEILLMIFIFVYYLQKRYPWYVRACIGAVGWILATILCNIDVIRQMLYQILGTNANIFFILYVIYIGAPILMAMLVLYCLAGISWSQTMYGFSILYMVQHIGFSVRSLLVGEYYGDWWQLLRNWMIFTVVAIPAAIFVARRIGKDGSFQVSKSTALLTFGTVILLVAILNLIMRMNSIQMNRLFYQLYLIYDICCCMFLLLMQIHHKKELELESSLAAEHHLRVQMGAQYSLSRESIDIINRKSHDLKHQIGMLRRTPDSPEKEDLLQELEKDVLIYDTIFRTGNEAVDTVLTEKGLLCRENDIQWTCMADGSLLNHMAIGDIYALLGNILDNAIEACRQVKAIEERVINVTLAKRAGVVTLDVENCYDGNLSYH